MMREGCVTVTDDYENYLDQILECQEQDAPLNHIKKYGRTLTFMAWDRKTIIDTFS